MANIKEYNEVAIPFKISNTGFDDTSLINSPLIVNGVPIGVITEMTDDWLSGFLFNKYVGYEKDIEFNKVQAIHISTLD